MDEICLRVSVQAPCDPGMVDVVSRQCEMCDKQKTFNMEGERMDRFCMDHKEAGMVNVKNRHCERCDKKPQFNMPSNQHST